MRISFLRRQAETCFRLAQSCSDAATAEELRLIGAEFFRKATKAETQELCGWCQELSEDTIAGGTDVGSKPAAARQHDLVWPARHRRVGVR